MRDISIIIVTYNSQDQIAKCLESITSSARKNLHFNLILVDNASVDKSTEVSVSTVKKLGLGNARFIKNDKNTGFAKAVNQGLSYALEKFSSDFFLLLNPDAFLEKDCIDKMIKKAEKDNGTGLFSPLIIDPKTNQPWFSGAKIDWLKMQTQHLSFSTSYVTNYLSGCCLLISRPLIFKIGLLDERFFLYYEDADYSLRARKSGVKAVLVKDAICYHSESQSSVLEIKNYHLVKSGLLFFQKYYYPPALPYFWLIFYLRLLYHQFFFKKKEVLRALKDFRKEK